MVDEGAVDEDLVRLAEAEAGGIELDRFAVLRMLLNPHPGRSVGSRRAGGGSRQRRRREGNGGWRHEQVSGCGGERAGERRVRAGFASISPPLRTGLKWASWE